MEIISSMNIYVFPNKLMYYFIQRFVMYEFVLYQTDYDSDVKQVPLYK